MNKIFLPSSWVAYGGGIARAPLICSGEEPTLNNVSYNASGTQTFTAPLELRGGSWVLSVDKIGPSLPARHFSQGLNQKGTAETFAPLDQLSFNGVLVFGFGRYLISFNVYETRWGPYSSIFKTGTYTLYGPNYLQCRSFDPELKVGSFYVGARSYGTCTTTAGNLETTLSKVQEDYYFTSTPCSLSQSFALNYELPPQEVNFGPTPVGSGNKYLTLNRITSTFTVNYSL